MCSPLAAGRRVAALALVGLALGAPADAFGDVHVRGTCGSGARAELRLSADGGSIRVRFRVDRNRAGERWRVVLVHERRVVWRGRRRTRSGSGSFRIRRSVPNFPGADQVGVRASGPGGNTCSATAVLAGG